MDSAEIVRIISFFLLIVMNARIIYVVSKREKYWRAYVLPLAWSLHAMVFYIATILRLTFGCTLGLSTLFLNYWSQLVRLQAIVSFWVYIGQMHDECRP